MSYGYPEQSFSSIQVPGDVLRRACARGVREVLNRQIQRFLKNYDAAHARYSHRGWIARLFHWTPSKKWVQKRAFEDAYGWVFVHDGQKDRLVSLYHAALTAVGPQATSDTITLTVFDHDVCRMWIQDTAGDDSPLTGELRDPYWNRASVLAHLTKERN